MKSPKWTAAFCSLFVINMFSSGTMKVCGIFFDSMETVDGISGSLAGLIFVTPSAVSHLIAPVVSVLSTHLSHRQLGSAGGVLVGGSFICSGLFATHGLHFLYFSIIAGFGFGLLFLPSVLCLREQAGDEFASLMPLATIGTYVGIAVLPGIVDVFLKNYGLSASYCMFGALLWNTVPCGLLLTGGSDRNVVGDDDIQKGEVSLSEERGNIDETQPTSKSVERKGLKGFSKDTPAKFYEMKTFQRRVSPMINSIKSFLLTFFAQFKLFGDLVFTLYFLTANLRKFPANSWTLFLIPYNQELGLNKSTAIFISAIGGIGGIVGRFVAAVSFKVTNKVSPLTLFAFYYLCNAAIFVLLDSWRNVIFMTLCGFFSGLLISAISGMTSGILLHMTTDEAFPNAFGLVDCGCGVYAILTGFISGGFYDAFGSFKVVFRIGAVVCAVSCVMVVGIKVIQTHRKKKHEEQSAM